MISEPYKKLGEFDPSELLNAVNEETTWRNRVSSIATEVLYIPNNNLDSLVESLVNQHIRPLYTDFIYFYRIHKLEPGTKILPHKDCEGDIPSLHVIHFVLTTNPKALFTIDNSTVNMEAGSIYEINYSYEHSVVNSGDTDRIHLLMEIRCA